MATVEILDDTDSEIVGSLAIGPVAPGAATTPVELHVWWARTEPLEADILDVSILGLARLTGTSDAFSADSTALMVSGGLQIRRLGGAWVSLGGGRSFIISIIEADSFVPVEVRASAPIGANGPVDVDALLEPQYLPAPEWARGLERGGVRSGIGDRSESAIYRRDADVAEESPESDTVDTPAVGWLYRGVPYQIAASTETLSANDGDAAALASGEEYIAALTLGAGSITVTKGSKGTAPLTTSDRPTLPDDEPLLAYVTRDFAATIGASDIVQGPSAGVWSASASGLTLTISPAGPGSIVGDRAPRYSGPQVLTLTASSTEVIWLGTDGSLELVADGTDPADTRAIRLWRTTTDVSSVTRFEDLREWLPEPRVLFFQIDESLTTTGPPTRYADARRGGYLLPLSGEASMSIVDDPGSAGSTTVTVETSDSGAASWSTVAAPTIANGASPAIGDVVPSVTSIDRESILRAQVTAETATSQPAAGVATLRIHGEK